MTLELQKKYPRITNAKLTFLLSSHRYKSEVPVLNIDDIKFSRSEWKLININLNMKNSDTSLLKLGVEDSTKAHITNCTCGNWIFKNVHNITITNCNNKNDSEENSHESILVFEECSTTLISNLTVDRAISERGTYNLIKVKSSLITFKRSMFANIKVKGVLIDVSNSTLVIQNCRFLNKETSGGIIDIRNASVLRISDTLFHHNVGILASCISACNGSRMFIHNSIFSSNIGTAITFTNNSQLFTFGSEFYNNSSPFGGGAILSMHNSKCNISNCVFRQNLAVVGGALVFDSHSTSNVVHSKFIMNVAEDVGSAIYVNSSSTVSCDNCLLSMNNVHDDGYDGGAIRIVGLSRINVTNSVFKYNKGPETSCLSSTDDCILNIDNCTFTSNFGSVVGVKYYTNIMARNSMFHNNTSLDGGGAMYLMENCTVNIINSTFTANSALFTGGAIFAIDNSTLIVTDVCFTENTAGQTGSALYIEYSTLKLFNCQFHKNSAENEDYYAAAIAMEDYSLMNVSNSIFEQNRGPVSCVSAVTYCTLSIYNCTFSSNNGTTVSSVDNSNLIVNTCSFYSNTSPNDGAIFVSDCSTLSVLKSVFVQNSAKSGGAIFLNNQSEFLISDSSFYMNSAVASDPYIANRTPYSTGDGGAIYTYFRCKGEISQAIFYNNSATNEGGSIVVYNNSLLSVLNTVFENNTVNMKGAAVSVCNDSAIIIQNCSFQHNVANDQLISWGGAVYIDSHTSLQVYNSSFTGNVASLGGAVEAENNCSVMIYNCLFSQNRDSALHSYGIHLAISKSQFLNNFALLNGGALMVSSAYLLNVTNVTFSENTADNGGAMFVEFTKLGAIWDCAFKNNAVNVKGSTLSIHSSDVHIYRSNFTENQAEDGGCIFTENSHSLIIEQCNFTSNSATGGGGVIFAKTSQLNVKYSAFNNNTSINNGGAINAQMRCTINITDSTFIGNIATGSGGAIIGIENTTIYIFNTKILMNVDALYFDHNSVLVLNHSRLYRNTLGVVSIQNDSQFIGMNNTFQENTKLSCIFATLSTIYIDNCLFHNNYNHFTSGVIGFRGSIINIAECMFFKNTSIYGKNLLSGTYDRD